MRNLTVLFLVILLAGLTDPVWGQVSYGGGNRPAQSAGLWVSDVRFTFDGSTEPTANFSFDEPVYGVFFSRPGVLVGLGRGWQDDANGDAVTLTDFVVSGWGMVRPWDRKGIRPVVPIGLESSYRRVSREQDTGTFNAFEFTVLALGAGVGLERDGRTASVSARVLPKFGLATRSLGTDTGTSTILDADVDLSLGPWGGRLGVVLGYAYRWQRWNVDAGRFLPGAVSNDITYSGTQHTVRVGVLF